VVIWTFMVQTTGGNTLRCSHGYLLEIRSRRLLSRRGILLAGSRPPPPTWAPRSCSTHRSIPGRRGGGRLPRRDGGALLLLVEVVERQQRLITASRAALTSRAENLAEELRLLGDYLNGALIGLDEMGRVSSINQAGLEMLGLEHAGALGRPWQEVLRRTQPARRPSHAP